MSDKTGVRYDLFRGHPNAPGVSSGSRSATAPTRAARGSGRRYGGSSTGGRPATTLATTPPGRGGDEVHGGQHLRDERGQPRPPAAVRPRPAGGRGLAREAHVLPRREHFQGQRSDRQAVADEARFGRGGRRQTLGDGREGGRFPAQTHLHNTLVSKSHGIRAVGAEFVSTVQKGYHVVSSGWSSTTTPGNCGTSRDNPSVRLHCTHSANNIHFSVVAYDLEYRQLLASSLASLAALCWELVEYMPSAVEAYLHKLGTPSATNTWSPSSRLPAILWWSVSDELFSCMTRDLDILTCARLGKSSVHEATHATSR
ncbi:hypothetical protein THAOC_27154 [Thalassiosira oceanica]|uniref:Uncharacterized protein n=1 Tax=Thalassiosira oceanica TaxID=159749 RepID=K0RMB2_THAOC|nr:hypothetical protein THAOC_27154 [Thalassiosira oceanica]|eukprot:EJK53419.1 hypothetical protein THAOC_27154 [Thalassiosira oceanica]